MNASSTTMATSSPRLPFRYWHEVALALLLGGFLVAAAALEPRFAQWGVQTELSGDVWPLGVVALVMALIVITGGIDLSVGGVTALCAVTMGISVEAGLNVWLGAGVALLTGLAAGMINGALIARLSIHPLIVTLATMAGFRGAALAITEGRTIQGFPPEFSRTVQRSVLGLPLPMWFFIAAAIMAAVALSRMPVGRYLYAIGHNEQAARYSGVPTTRLKLTLYALSGLTCGMAAILLTARYEQAKADFATGLELEAITAVVLGGVSIYGGRGNVVGLLLGLALLFEFNKFVPWHWHKSELNALVTGALLIGSVLINSLLTRTRR